MTNYQPIDNNLIHHLGSKSKVKLQQSPYFLNQHSIDQVQRGKKISSTLQNKITPIQNKIKFLKPYTNKTFFGPPITFQYVYPSLDTFFKEVYDLRIKFETLEKSLKSNNQNNKETQKKSLQLELVINSTKDFQEKATKILNQIKENLGQEVTIDNYMNQIQGQNSENYNKSKENIFQQEFFKKQVPLKDQPINQCQSKKITQNSKIQQQKLLQKPKIQEVESLELEFQSLQKPQIINQNKKCQNLQPVTFKNSQSNCLQAIQTLTKAATKIEQLQKQNEQLKQLLTLEKDSHQITKDKVQELEKNHQIVQNHLQEVINNLKEEIFQLNKTQCQTSQTFQKDLIND